MKHPGQISNREDTKSDDKESMDLSIPVGYVEFDQRLDVYFNFLHQSFVTYFQTFQQAHLPCRISDIFNIQWYPKGGGYKIWPVSYTHLRAHETGRNLVCRLLLVLYDAIGFHEVYTTLSYLHDYFLYHYLDDQ